MLNCDGNLRWHPAVIGRDYVFKDTNGKFLGAAEMGIRVDTNFISEILAFMFSI